MFNFLKNKTVIDEPAVQQVLKNYQVANTAILELITAQQLQGMALNLTLRLPHDSNPEKIHYELSQQLHLLGIQEVNMNITLAAPPTQHEPLKSDDATNRATNRATNHATNRATSNSLKGSGHTLPKTTNAMASSNQHTTETDEPPITKKASTQSDLTPHPRIKHIIVVASGKGGVGKSTTTVNIALALQQLGHRVGVLDADIYGPSIPAMLNVAGVQPTLENEQFVPIDAHGMPMLSIGSLLADDNTPVAWRGSKATGALMQLYNQTNWPNLDYLVIDMPPGTGDIQLTLAQRIPVTGAVIVTTPQHIALLDAQKGIELFHKTQIPVLGVVENMALHTCSQCGHTEAIFGEGGGEAIAERYRVPLLGQLPLAKGIREQADKGQPSVSVGDEFADYYLTIAKNIAANINKFAKPHDNHRIF